MENHVWDRMKFADFCCVFAFYVVLLPAKKEKSRLMRYGLIITVSALLLLGGCRNASQKQEGNAATQQGQTEQPATEKTETKQNIIRKHINIPQDFDYITNLGCIDVIYTQGNYSIEVEGDSTTLNYLDVSFDNNLLTISLQTDKNTVMNRYGNTNNVKMRVSCPDLKCVSICGNGGFESQATWRTEDLQVGAMGTGTLKLASIECTTFSLQSTQPSTIKLNYLKAEDATLFSSSSAHIEMNVDVNNLIVLNEGTQTIKLTGKSGQTLIKNPKDKNLTNLLL